MLAVLCAVMAWIGIASAAVKPFWHDEIYTVQIARLSSIRDIWSACLQGVDLMPPLNTILTHAVSRITPLTEITARLPALTAYLLFVVLAFETARRRSNAVVGTTTALIAFFSAAFGFAYTARGYSLALALTLLALIAWAESARGHQRWLFLPLLTLSLAAAAWTHYFAVLIFLPILTGELTRLVRNRRLDWPMAVALFAPGMFLVPLAPLLRIATAESTTYWRRAHWSDIAATYQVLAGFLFARRFLAVGTAVTLACIAVALTRRRADRTLVTHEVAAGIAALLIPVVGVALGIFVTGAFSPRYAVAGVIGICLVGPLAVWRFGPKNGVLDLFLCIMLVAGFLQSAAATAVQPALLPDPIHERPLLAALLEDAGPVAITGVAYLECWYYAAPDVRSRIVYLTDPEASRRIVGSDTLERNYSALRYLAPVDVRDYRAFTAAHPAFDVYSEGDFGWLPAKLREDGADVSIVARAGDVATYRVSIASQ